MSDDARRARFGEMARNIGRGDTGRREPPEYDEDAVHWGHVALLVLGFAILFFATSFYFDASTKTYKRAKVPLGTMYGPIESTRPNQIIAITMRHVTPRQSWAFVEGVVLKDRRHRITGFGGEYFRQSGYDSDGSWSESERERDVKVVLPTPGQYWLQFIAEGGRIGASKGKRLDPKHRVEVSVAMKRGGAEILKWTGFFLLVVAVIMNEIRNRTVTGVLSRMGDDDDD